MYISYLGVFLISVKPSTTEITENKTTPKFCKITVSVFKVVVSSSWEVCGLCVSVCLFSRLHVWLICDCRSVPRGTSWEVRLSALSRCASSSPECPGCDSVSTTKSCSRTQDVSVAVRDVLVRAHLSSCRFAKKKRFVFVRVCVVSVASAFQNTFQCVSPSGGWACTHYVMVSKFQWKPFWLTTQLYAQNGWTGWQNRVNNDVLAQAPLLVIAISLSTRCLYPQETSRRLWSLKTSSSTSACGCRDLRTIAPSRLSHQMASLSWCLTVWTRRLGCFYCVLCYLTSVTPDTPFYSSFS